MQKLLKYEFHWSNGDVTAPLYFETDSDAWNCADQTQIAIDAGLERTINVLKTALGEETLLSKRLILMRRLSEAQSDYENAPVVDYLIKTTARGKVKHITR